MDWRFNTIWFEQLGPKKFFQQDFKGDTIESRNKNFETAEYAILWHLKEGTNAFENLPKSDKLLFLSLHWANIKNFKGIEKFSNLRRLELQCCIKLENDLGIGRLSKNLQFLHIDQSRKFKFTDELFQLKKLKVLCVNDCDSLDNLAFLKQFPNLIDFRFVNTNVSDGNLTPILDHPTIRTTGFLNKKHYNYKKEKISKELENKFNSEYKTYAHKGIYQTFRYDYE